MTAFLRTRRLRGGVRHDFNLRDVKEEVVKKGKNQQKPNYAGDYPRTLFPHLFWARTPKGEYERDISLVEWYRTSRLAKTTPPGTRKSTYCWCRRWTLLGKFCAPHKEFGN